ncbi:hypothetical protein PCASD_02649 [Puccinia coronata f. sp. avenae]|uniref:Integrase catalytic domain-containing protein n=1 Tax=Puccinia coronata f. sp. avenae TaxID=200324 RepID=A0A2N5VH57_9BASI|nr:hypothetical protein PCASD_02649 [Puccinia coronata f. sp. avenae]
MADNEGASSKVNIPRLDEKNYLHWSMRIKAHLRHKGLLKYILEFPVPLSGAAANAVAKKHAKTVDILMNFMSETAFESVITPDNEDSPYGIWTQIVSRYASTSSNNKGRVWLKFMRYEYRGNLSKFITDMHKMLIKIALVKLGVPDNILCFSILSKLSEDLWNVVDNIIMNEVIIESPNATLTKLQELVHLEELRKKKTHQSTTTIKTEDQSDTASALMHESKKGKQRAKKDGPICENGKHNPAVTSHTSDMCWEIHPDQRKQFMLRFNRASGEKPTAQLVEADDGHESEASLLLTEAKSKPIVLDTGATHHLVNNPDVFRPTSESSMKISTGGHSNFLNATAIGTATLTNHKGEKFLLDNALLVPTLNRSLISIPRLFKSLFVVKKLDNNEVEIEVDGGYKLLGSVKNNLLEIHSSHFDAIQPDSSCYQSSPVAPNWHVRLGHPNHKYLKHLKLEERSEECSICKECKLKALPFSSKFKTVTEVLEAVHMDLVAFDRFVEFKTSAEKDTKKSIRLLVSDGGGEFVNEKFKEFCTAEGISHHVTPAYTPQNNGMAERANQAILTKARCLLVQSKLPKMFWSDAINTATQLSNLTPSNTRRMKVPYETWTGRKANLEALRPFGCRTYSLIPKEKREFKLDPTAEKGIMVGYENDFSTYRVYKIEEKRIVRGRNIKFEEETFPGLTGIREENPNQDIFEVSNHLPPSDDQPSLPADTAPSPEHSTVNISSPPSAPKAPQDISSQISTDNILSVDRRGNSIIVYLTEITENVANNTPKTYIQAINSPNSSFWKKAIEKEISNMYDHDVWAIVRKSGDQSRINCTWVFKVKKDQLNIPIEYKARLCAKGFQQTKGTDYGKTFAPTGKIVSLRMLIVFALKNNLKFHQIDIKSAFLNAPLQEELYLNPPQGVDVPADHVLKLNKAMYGLKQAPNAWHRTLSEWLFQIGFRRCKAEPCVFWRKGTFLYLHVDDLAIFSKNPEEFKAEVRSRFQIKDLGESSLLLGMNVIQADDSVTLTQRHYIDTQLERFNCQDLFPASTPMKPKGHLLAATSQEKIDHIESGNNFRALVGALNYLSTTTRPDITFAVSSLSQYLNAPGINHWEAGIQVLRYLKGTRDVGLKLSKNPVAQDSLVGYADADWASCPESRRSVSGNLILLNGNVISWKSKKQPTLSLSSTEAEYKSIGDITKEIMWIKTLLKKIFNIKLKEPTPIFEDNQGAIALANNESNHSNFKTKHMSLRHHFIRREIKIKSIVLNMGVCQISDLSRAPDWSALSLRYPRPRAFLHLPPPSAESDFLISSQNQQLWNPAARFDSPSSSPRFIRLPSRSSAAID